MCVHRESGAQRAVKVLRKSHMDEDEKRMLFNEINILREIVSPFTSNTCLNAFTLTFSTLQLFLNYNLGILLTRLVFRTTPTS